MTSANKRMSREMKASDMYELDVVSTVSTSGVQASPSNSEFHVEPRDFGDELTQTERELFEIVKHGIPQKVKDFLKDNVPRCDLKKKDGEFHSLLQIAVLRRDLEIVSLLADAGCRDPYALELAGALHFNEILKLLIEKSPPDSRLPSIQEDYEGLDQPAASSAPRSRNEQNGEDVKRSSQRSSVRLMSTAVAKFKGQAETKDKPRFQLAVSELQSHFGLDGKFRYLDKSKDQDEDVRRMLKAATEAADYTETKKLVEMIRNKLPNTSALSLHCLCPKCRDKNEAECGNVLEEAKDRLDVCRILSSPTYILVTAWDPILTALKWATHLQSMAYWHSENKDEFLELAERCSKLAVDLLVVCDDDKNVKLLFEGSYELEKQRFLPVKNTIKYKRLHDAVGLLQKQFVTHPTCQHVLSKLWLGNYYTRWRKWSWSRRTLHVLSQIMLVPIIFILFVCKVKFAKECLKAPINRFIYAATSYSFFLLTVVANQYVQRARNWPTPSVDGYDFVISIWVFGHVCKIASDFVTQRHFSYSRLWWGTYEAIMMAFFIAGGATFIVGFGSDSTKVANWKVALLSQGFYAIAMTLAFMRTLQWLHLSRTLGPLVISFSRMTVVLRRLLIIFGVVVLSFSVGIYTIYKNFTKIFPEDEDENDFFSSYLKTLKILFWAILGKGEGDFAQIPSNYRYSVRDVNVTTEFRESFTVVVGYTLWSFFHIAVVVVLLNMLIAVMTHYYQIIQDNGDMEWKFACTKLRMYYIEKYTRFPPPLNIVPMAYRIGRYIINRYWKGLSTDQVDAKKRSYSEQGRQKHQVVVKELIKRYLHGRDIAKSREQRQ